ARRGAEGRDPRCGEEPRRAAADHRPRLLRQRLVERPARDLATAHARTAAAPRFPVSGGPARGGPRRVSARDGPARVRRRRPLTRGLKGAIMANLVLGIATSHTPMLTLPAELWSSYAQNDERNRGLAFPRDGVFTSYAEGLRNVTPQIGPKFRGTEPYRAQAESCQRALDELSATLRAVNPDVTVIIGDDQDEWFFEDNMPALSVFWGDTAPLIPRQMPPGTRDPEVIEAIRRGYGDVPMDVPVASAFGRYLTEHLTGHHFAAPPRRHVKQRCGGTLARRYPTRRGELDYVRETPPREQGLPHAFSFIVKRLFDNRPRPIVPVFQNTCYHP